MRHLILILVAFILFSSCEKNEVVEDRNNPNCNGGYTGFVCDVELPPKSITIKDIEVAWFSGITADIAIKVKVLILIICMSRI